VARIRTIKPEFWSNEKVMNSSRNSRLLFIGLWNYADDAGRIADSAKTIKAQIFPGDDDVNSEMVRGMIDDLASNGLLQKYEVEGRGYLQITGWDHQRIDKPKLSRIPPPNSTTDPRPILPVSILSTPTVSNLRGSLAALPSGALAPEKKEAGRGPSQVGRAELQAIFDRKKI
jgi:hypothetical protein